MKKIVEKIINSIPNNLTELEKAYFVYLELGKILNIDTGYFLSGSRSKKDRIFENGKNFERINSTNVICNSSAELYAHILNKLNINACCFYYNNFTHADVLIEGPNASFYYVNMLQDLYNIQTGARTRHFAPPLEYINEGYRRELQEENFLGLASVSSGELERMDKKLGYSFHGIYLNDFINRIKLEIKNPDFVNEYILPNGVTLDNCSPQNLLKYKFLFLINNLNAYSETPNRSIGFLELERYYEKLCSAILSPEEDKKVMLYACYPKGSELSNDSLSSYISLELAENNIMYFSFSSEKNKYISLSKEELQQQVNNGLTAYKTKFKGIERER